MTTSSSTNRVGKGAGNAIGKKFSRHLEVVKVNRPKLVFHSLRKFCNNYLLENDVSMEARCQFIGHELGSVELYHLHKQDFGGCLGKVGPAHAGKKHSTDEGLKWA